METGGDPREHDNPLPLKPSLVEWKQCAGRWSCTSGYGLETFLGGMETGERGKHRGMAWRLETFLGGMETCRPRSSPAAAPALKPSLVEWKHQRLLMAQTLEREP